MNAPENCGRAPLQVCAGAHSGRRPNRPPRGTVSAGGARWPRLRRGGPPLPLRKLRLYTKYISYNSFKFILFSTDLPPSAIRQVSIFCQSPHPSGQVRAKGSSPTPPQALCQAKESGRSPLRPFLYILYFIIKLYIYSTESPMALRLQMPCIIFGASKLRGTIRRKKIKNNIVSDGFAFVGKEDASQREGLSR